MDEVDKQVNLELDGDLVQGGLGLDEVTNRAG